MAATAEYALKTAIGNVHGGINLGAIGSLVETTIRNRGFKPISNLTGHSVGSYLIHAGTSIPSVSGFNPRNSKQAKSTPSNPSSLYLTPSARVDDHPQNTIYRLLKAKSTKNPAAKKLLKHIETNFHTLPFAERWIIGVVPVEQHKAAFKELLASKAIMTYPVFVEASKKPVAQAEHTVLVKEEGCEVLT